MTDRPILDVTVRGFTAWLLAPTLRQEIPRLVELGSQRGMHPELLAEARRTLRAVELLAQQWADWRASADGNTETVAAETGAPSDRDLTTEQAAALIGRSERRVRQLLADDVLTGRRVGRQWLVDRESVVIYLEARRSAA